MSTSPHALPAVTPDDALWRLAYAITGDRAAARAVVSLALARGASTELTPARLRAEVVALARGHVARAGRGAGAHHDRLWNALRPLPRRARADVVLRLREHRSAR